MISKLKNLRTYLHDARDRQRIQIALTRGGIGLHNRTIVESDPHSWEFAGFSQNGEDGILHYLRSKLKSSNHTFVEIGAADGIQNNSGWLAVAEQYAGVMIEGNPALVERARRVVAEWNIGVKFANMFITRDSAAEVRALMPYADPDVFSLDIDGNDFHIAKALMLDANIRPKIFVVEYNAVFGPTKASTIPYDPAFSFDRHPTKLYYGVSVRGWRNFFQAMDYRFVSVDRHGVNAFFVDPQHFDAAFLDQIKGVDFIENVYQLDKWKKPNHLQYELIKDQAFVSLEPDRVLSAR